MYLVRVDNGNTARVSLDVFNTGEDMTYRVSLSDILAVDQVVSGKSEDREPKLAGILRVASASVGLQQQCSSRNRRADESATQCLVLK